MTGFGLQSANGSDFKVRPGSLRTQPLLPLAVVCGPKEVLGHFVDACDGIAEVRAFTSDSIDNPRLNAAMKDADFCLMLVGHDRIIENALVRTQQLLAKKAKLGFVCLTEETGHVAVVLQNALIPFVCSPEPGMHKFEVGKVMHVLHEPNLTGEAGKIVRSFMGFR